MTPKLLLQLPLPVFAAVVVPQLEPEVVTPELPAFVATLLLGGWIVLWFLDRIGKLPFQRDDRRSSTVFTNDDRVKLDALHRLFLFRDDQDGIERFPMFMKEARASHKDIKKLVELQEQATAHLKSIAESSRSGGSI